MQPADTPTTPIPNHMTVPPANTPRRFTENDLVRVKEAARLVDVVGKTVHLKHTGGGTWKGLCPFHDEKTPSFTVSEDKNVWYCFGCSEGGDVIDFVQRNSHLTFPEAVTQIVLDYGVTLDNSVDVGEESARWQQRRNLYTINKLAAEWWHQQLLKLPESHPAWAFLTERGFTREDAVLNEVGFSPPGGSDLYSYLKSRNVFSLDDCVQSGVVGVYDNRPYDKFRARLMFPIVNAGGSYIGVGARKLYDKDKGPKYLNTGETPVYHKSEVLYGLNVARKHSDRIVVVEGYTDVMACRAAGVLGAVASCGTAFGEGHVNLLRRTIGDDSSWTGEVVFFFDGDKAGKKAALRAFTFEDKFVFHTYGVTSPNGDDPCEVWQKSGEEGLRNLIDQRVPLVEFTLKNLLQDVSQRTLEEKLVALENVAAPILREVTDLELRAFYEGRVAHWLGLPQGRVATTVSSQPGERRTAPSTLSGGQFGGHVAYGSDEWNEYLAASVCVQHPHLVPGWRDAVDEDMLTSPTLRSLWIAVKTATVPEQDEDSTVVDAPTLSAKVLNLLADDPEGRTVFSLLSTVSLPVGDTEYQQERFAVEAYARLLDRFYEREEEKVTAQLSNVDPSNLDEVLSLWDIIEKYQTARVELDAVVRTFN